MILKDFNEFFTACAGVSGALIGLLFVAISIRPEKLSSAPEHVEHQVKAGAAFSALINTLLVSLFALIPGSGIGQSTFILACVGLASTAGLTIFFLRDRDHDVRIRPGQVALLVTAVVLYGLQLGNALRMWHSPHSVGDVRDQADILIAFFIVAIARAWDLVGASDTSLIGGAAEMARRTHAAHSAHHTEGDEEPAAG